MAVLSVKTTYSLDVDTVATLEKIARLGFRNRKPCAVRFAGPQVVFRLLSETR